jgi:hypothetical protein
MKHSDVLTPLEVSFVYHCYSELIRAMQSDYPSGDPAFQWLRDHGVPHSLMQVLEYAVQKSNPDWIREATEEPLPRFEVPWSSREEFESRVCDLLEIFPEMKSIGSANPEVMATDES